MQCNATVTLEKAVVVVQCLLQKKREKVILTYFAAINIIRLASQNGFCLALLFSPFSVPAKSEKKTVQQNDNRE